MRVQIPSRLVEDAATLLLLRTNLMGSIPIIRSMRIMLNGEQLTYNQCQLSQQELLRYLLFGSHRLAARISVFQAEDVSSSLTGSVHCIMCA